MSPRPAANPTGDFPAEMPLIFGFLPLSFWLFLLHAILRDVAFSGSPFAQVTPRTASRLGAVITARPSSGALGFCRRLHLLSTTDAVVVVVLWFLGAADAGLFGAPPPPGATRCLNAASTPTESERAVAADALARLSHDDSIRGGSRRARRGRRVRPVPVRELLKTYAALADR